MTKKLHLKMLEEGTIPQRYQRNIGTIGILGQKKLLNSKVAIVGAGGLGGCIVESLARYGVGYLKIIDGDEFAQHNLNRQVLATEHNLGENKAIAAAKRVFKINSDVAILPVNQMLSKENAFELLKGMDVIVDALDNISCRLLLERTARELNVPLVHGAIAGFIGQVTTILPKGLGFEKIYKNTASSDKGIEVSLGNPASTPAITAGIQSLEVVKLLTGIGEVLSGKLLYFDSELNIYEILELV